MDIEELIERLRTESLYADLSTLQAENENLRAELNICKEKNAGLALALLTECAPNPDCLGDDEWRAIRVELEQVKRERDAAVKDLNEFLSMDELCPIQCEWCKWKDTFCNGKTPEWRGIKED